MIDQSKTNAPDIVQNFSQQSAQLVGETSRWLTGNSLGILIAAGFGVLIAAILLGIRSVGCRLLRGRSGYGWRSVFGRVLARTNLFFIVMCSAELVAEHAATPSVLLRIITFLFVIAAAFQGAIWVRELILGFIQHRVGAEEEPSRLGSAIGLIRLLVSVALFAIAIILILSNLGVDVTGLVAGLGIGGIAIGLAAQGIFSDLFAALSIIFDRPFRRGDGIKFDEISGTVEQIGLKTTRVRSLSGEQVVVSNANLLDKQIHNYAEIEHRRIVTTLGLVYQTPPDVCAKVPGMIRDIVEKHPPAKMVRCGFVNFGASTLDFELQFDVHSPDYEVVFNTRHAIFLAILDTFNKAGIGFAYPTQTTFTAAPDGTMVMPYPDVTMVATKDVKKS